MGAIDRDRLGNIQAGPAEKTRIEQSRIDRQRLARIMGADLERQPIGRGKPVAAGDRRATSSNILVDRGLALTNARAANLEGQFTIAVDLQPVGTLQAELDATGGGTRMDDEVVF